MEWIQTVPSFVWELPTQILVIILLSLGVFVTKREHANMIEMMKYFRTISENKEETILNQAKAMEVYKEIAPLLKEVLQGIKVIAKEKEKSEGTDV